MRARINDSARRQASTIRASGILARQVSCDTVTVQAEPTDGGGTGGDTGGGLPDFGSGDGGSTALILGGGFALLLLVLVASG